MSQYMSTPIRQNERRHRWHRSKSWHQTFINILIAPQVLVSTIFQVTFTIIFGSIYPLVNLILATIRLSPPNLQKLVFTSLYDTSITVTTSIGLASFLSSKPEAGIYQLSYLGFLLELSIGCLICAYTLIGKNSRHPRARFVAALPAWVFFIAGQVSAKKTAKGIMKSAVLPFFATLGTDCPENVRQPTVFKHVLYTEDPLHYFSLMSFFAFTVYFFVTGLGAFPVRRLRGT